MRINFIHLFLLHVGIAFSGQFWRILLKNFEHLKSFCDFSLFMVKCIFSFDVYLWLFADFDIVIRSLFIQLLWINNVRMTTLALDSQKCSLVFRHTKRTTKESYTFFTLAKKFPLFLFADELFGEIIWKAWVISKDFSSEKSHILRKNFKSIKFSSFVSN